MTTPMTSEQESGFSRALWAIAVLGVLATLAGLLVAGGRTAIGIGIGSAIAAANLWSIMRVVRGLLAPKPGSVPWGLIAAVKFVVLIGGVYLLVKSGWVDLVTLLIGYGALPVGIVSAQLGAARTVSEEG
jgi:hypothetical protein